MIPVTFFNCQGECGQILYLLKNSRRGITWECGYRTTSLTIYEAFSSCDGAISGTVAAGASEADTSAVTTSAPSTV